MADEFIKAALYWIKTFNKKAKEKIWMMKLIELLNEFEYYNKNCEFWKEYNNYTYRKREEYELEEDLTKNCMNITFILSKKFWFIKWLVENDKIDIDKLEKKVLKENLIRKFDEWLLMLLAIQDEPIRFLCEILK